MDLAKLNAIEATKDVVFDMEILHPVTEEPTGLFIQLVSTYTDQVRQVSRAQTNDILKRNFEAQRAGKNAKVPTIEDGDRRGAALLSAATVGWYERKESTIGQEAEKIDGLPFGPNRLIFSKAEAEKLYSSPGYDWLAKQVDKTLGELGNFTKPSSSGSSTSPVTSSN